VRIRAKPNKAYVRLNLEEFQAILGIVPYFAVGENVLDELKAIGILENKRPC
jgi:hypothetical protein